MQKIASGFTQVEQDGEIIEIENDVPLDDERLNILTAESREVLTQHRARSASFGAALAKGIVSSK